MSITEEQARQFTERALAEGIQRERIITVLRGRGYGATQLPALGAATPSREASAKQALSQATALRRQKTPGEKIGGAALDVGLTSLGAALGSPGGLPGIAAGGGVGAAVSDVIQQKYEKSQGLREGYDPGQSGIQAGIAAGTPVALGGVTRALGVSGGVTRRGIAELEKSGTGRGLRLLTPPRQATLGRASETMGMTGKIRADVAQYGRRKLPEVMAGEQAAERATQAGRSVDIRPALQRMTEFIRPGTEEPTQVAVQNKLIDLAAKYERTAQGGKVTPTQALDMLRELRTPVAGKFEAAEGTLYQKGLKRAQHALEVMFKRSLDSRGRMEFARAAVRLRAIERLSERITPSGAVNTVRNLWKRGGEQALEELKAYDKANGTDFVRQTYDLAIRDELSGGDLNLAHKLIQSVLPIVGNAWLAGARSISKGLAFITRPSGGLAAAGARQFYAEPERTP